MKSKLFESTLPDGYVEVYHFNAKAPKVAITLNLVPLAIMAITVVISMIPIYRDGFGEVELADVSQAFIVFALTLIGYVVLHELVHGMAYKCMTHEKLTFGIIFSCAFCGVPNIYTYRRTALVALTAPLVVFTVIMVPVLISLYGVVSNCIYLAVSMVVGQHFGGCIGDVYMTVLLLTKFRDRDMLMRDTGPEQFIYLPDRVENKEV